MSVRAHNEKMLSGEIRWRAQHTIGATPIMDGISRIFMAHQ